jgi:UDP-N-acetylmuramoyl-L-alanine---L-glutamate ligase
MRIAELAGQRVAIWGFGREGRAAIHALRKRLPDLSLALYCGEAEAAEAQAFDPAIRVYPHEPDAVALSAYDIVIKSPGISAYKPAIITAQAQGTRFTSGTALWFGENPQARVVAITGTKGKSTTTALLAHLARALGVRTALAGNIGLPMLELLDSQAELWAIELSSFQTGEAGSLELGVITSLYEEHLDWHGSRERYVADKLKLVDVSRRLLVNGEQVSLLEKTAHHAHRLLFGQPEGWHVADGFIRRGAIDVFALDRIAVPGVHNALNACAALAALEAMGYDAVAAAPALATFRPLPHRLQPLGEHDGLQWINDSISTTPEATLAALDSLHGREVTVIVGGHDRGLDWAHFVDAVPSRTALRIITQGANGPRIAAALRAAKSEVPLGDVDKLVDAIEMARIVTPEGGTVLLSPGAPSFDQFHDYAERGRRFAGMIGLDESGISGIAGMGIAGGRDDEHDLAALQGAWEQVAHEADGIVNPPDDLGAPGAITTFTGHHFAVRTPDGELLLEGSFTLDASLTPKAITWIDAIGPDAGKSLPASYVLEGDYFQFIAGDEGAPRPVVFRTSSGQTMRAFVRRP